MDKSKIVVLIVLVFILSIFMMSRGNNNSKTNSNGLLKISKLVTDTSTGILNISVTKVSDDSIVPETSSSYTIFYLIGSITISMGFLFTYRYSRRN